MEGGGPREGRRFPAFLTHAVLDSFAPFVVITALLALMRCRGERVKSASERTIIMYREKCKHAAHTPLLVSSTHTFFT